MRKTEKDILEMGKEKLEQLKVVFEELEVQLALGKKEAKDAFEKEKKKFQEYIEDQRERFKQEEEEAEQHRHTLVELLTTLEAGLSKEPPTTKKEFTTYKDDLLRAIYELEAGMKDAYDKLRFSVREEMDQFKARLDAFRIKLALSDVEKMEAVEERREDLKENVAAMGGLLKAEAERGDKVETFVDEVTASFDHLKKAFTELFS